MLVVKVKFTKEKSSQISEINHNLRASVMPTRRSFELSCSLGVRIVLFVRPSTLNCSEVGPLGNFQRHKSLSPWNNSG